MLHGKDPGRVKIAPELRDKLQVGHIDEVKYMVWDLFRNGTALTLVTLNLAFQWFGNGLLYIGFMYSSQIRSCQKSI